MNAFEEIIKYVKKYASNENNVIPLSDIDELWHSKTVFNTQDHHMSFIPQYTFITYIGDTLFPDYEKYEIFTAMSEDYLTPTQEKNKGEVRRFYFGNKHHYGFFFTDKRLNKMMCNLWKLFRENERTMSLTYDDCLQFVNIMAGLENILNEENF